MHTSKIITAAFLLVSSLALGQNIGIGTNSPQAKLDITSTTTGILIPRMTTAQKNAIVSPPKGLLIFDSSLNQLTIYGGSGWSNVSAAGSDYWQSQLTGAEQMINNNYTSYRRVLVGNRPIQPSVGFSNSPNGAFTVWSRAFGLTDFNNYLTMDGQGIQARSQNFTVAGPQFEDKLLLNRFGGSVGIGTSPDHSMFEVAGTVGASAAMFGAGKAGISIHADNPEIGFNYYYNNGTKTMKAGYAANIGMYPNNGDLYIGTFGAYTSSTDFGDISSAGFQQVITVKQSGRVGIGTAFPESKLQVVTDQPTGPAILAIGKGYNYSQVVDQNITYNIYDHQPGIHAGQWNGGTALQISGPVAIPQNSNDFSFDVFPQNTNSNNLGYYFQLANGFWVIKLTGSNSPLNDPIWPGQKILQVTPYFVGSIASSSFLIPTQTAVFYSTTDGETYFVLNQAPVQTGKPIYRLKVWFVRVNPSVGTQ